MIEPVLEFVVDISLSQFAQLFIQEYLHILIITHFLGQLVYSLVFGHIGCIGNDKRLHIQDGMFTIVYLIEVLVFFSELFEQDNMVHDYRKFLLEYRIQLWIGIFHRELQAPGVQKSQV